MKTTKYPTVKDWFKDSAKGYEFSGLFYKTDDGTPCRRVLDIRKIGSEKDFPDLIVIMMNPGGSHPSRVNSINDVEKIDLNNWVPTFRDDTQLKVTEFMNKTRLNNNIKKEKHYYARVFNLTDICEVDSNAFVFTKRKNDKLPCYNKQSIESNSIFNNQTEIDYYFETNIDILLAWGVKPVFNKIISDAKKFIITNSNQHYIFGYSQKKDEKNLYFYHPLVRPSIKHEIINWHEGLKYITQKVKGKT